MPAPSNLHAYPDVYFKLFAKALIQKIELSAESEEDAIKLRAALYGFRKALIAKAETADDMALAVGSQCLVFKLKGNTLTIENRQASAETKLIENALASIEPEAEADDSQGGILDVDQLPNPH